MWAIHIIIVYRGGEGGGGRPKRRWLDIAMISETGGGVYRQISTPHKSWTKMKKIIA